MGLPSLSEGEIRDLSDLVAQWKKVTMFFMLRVALAPCVESLLLLDRAIFLTEQNISSSQQLVEVNLVPIFDPTISPRNMALVAFQKEI